ncbi:hypothetical protein F2Q68_00015586 [Brassica cretica]|uniref:Uncharacterized protein n=1 Tax=Brassica cretica TaxID=69181 RepID=A0A8S9HEN2_BRACR|nr:hypothetical protein F2Q68_00015586 [Brassica cretica]
MHVLYSALATSSSAPPLEACSWLQALLQAPKGTEENRGHDQCGLSSRKSDELVVTMERERLSLLVGNPSHCFWDHGVAFNSYPPPVSWWVFSLSPRSGQVPTSSPVMRAEIWWILYLLLPLSLRLSALGLLDGLISPGVELICVEQKGEKIEEEQR